MTSARALLPVGALLLALGLPVDAQPPKKTSRVGYLAAVSAAADAPRLEAFRQGLRDLGYIEGQNIVIEHRHEGGGFERLPELAAEPEKDRDPDRKGFADLIKVERAEDLDGAPLHLA